MENVIMLKLWVAATKHSFDQVETRDSNVLESSFGLTETLLFFVSDTCWN